MATKAEEHRAADPPIRVPAEHHTAAEKRKEREEEEDEEAEEDDDEEEKKKKVETGSKRRRRCQLALDKESNGSFSFDTRCAVPIETTPKFGSFNYSALAVDLAELGEKKIRDAAAEQENSGTQREVGGSGENKDGI